MDFKSQMSWWIVRWMAGPSRQNLKYVFVMLDKNYYFVTIEFVERILYMCLLFLQPDQILKMLRFSVE